METLIKPNAKPAAGEREKPKTDAILEAAQAELMRHNWDTFVNNPPSMAQGGKGTVVPGCTACKKILYSDHDYLSHLAIDVLPQILERILRLSFENH
jgi:phosphatidylinositol kinase/protein kinase (PI-3  family)